MRKPHIQVIIGSVRESRVGTSIASWFMDQIDSRDDISLELVDLKNWELPLEMEAKSPAYNQYEKDITKKWSKQISKADGYIFITPEYNHSFPASLKLAIDTLFHEWHKKPAGFVGYGGLGAARAIESLIPVVARVGMMPIASPTVNILDVWSAVDNHGKLDETFVRGDANVLLDSVSEWAIDLAMIRDKVLQTA